MRAAGLLDVGIDSKHRIHNLQIGSGDIGRNHHVIGQLQLIQCRLDVCMQTMNLDGGTSAIMWYDGEYVTKCPNQNLPEDSMKLFGGSKGTRTGTGAAVKKRESP